MPSYRSLLADMLGLRFIATGGPVEEIDKRDEDGARRAMENVIKVGRERVVQALREGK